MKITYAIIGVLSLLVASSHQNIDLGPAYRIHMSGSDKWTIERTYDKSPLFVEGFEMLDDETLLESVGGYWGSSIQTLAIDQE